MQTLNIAFNESITQEQAEALNDAIVIWLEARGLTAQIEYDPNAPEGKGNDER